MGTACVVNERNQSEKDTRTPFSRRQLPDMSKHTSDPSEADISSSEEEEFDLDHDDHTSNAMQKEIIVLATRNANLQQELDVIQQKYQRLLLTKQDSARSTASTASQLVDCLVPIASICEDLGIDQDTLPQQMRIAEIEALLLQIDPKYAVNESQHKLLSAVSKQMSDHLLGLLNVLVTKHNYDMFYKCILMEMISFIYDDVVDEQQDTQDPEGKDLAQQHLQPTFDLQSVYEIAEVLKVSQSKVDELNSAIQERLNNDNKIGNIFVEN